MCGIAGLTGNGWGAREDHVRSMLFSLRHRGPDDEGVETRSGATLGARRLAIIDLARGHQPMSSEDGNIMAVQNGEIYNFREVRADLEARGHRFHTDNDTEVVPHAYEEHGDGFVEHLRGMFAIALWDAHRERLLLVRDRLGKKPLFYALARGGIAFASEIQALLTLDIDRVVDPIALREYLARGYIGAPRTGFASIRKVSPGTVLAFDGERAIARRYWRPAFAPKLNLSESEALDGLRSHLSESVRLRLISDVPLGVFLSGGIDSSTVAAIVAAESTRPVRTFSVGFPDADFSELRFARLVAERLGTDHHELMVEPSAVDVLPLLVRHLGEPYSDSSIVPSYYVAKAARRHVTVALNGDGGDELFGGYDRYRAARLARHLDRLPRAVRDVAASVARSLPEDVWMPKLLARARRFALPLALSGAARYAYWMSYFRGPAILGERLRDVALDDPVAHELGRDDGAADPIERLLSVDMQTYLPGDLLVKMDIATMASSLEGRSPFLDHHVVDYVNSLPLELKLRGSRTKYLLRRLMSGILPREVLERSKMGFSMPVGRWIRGPLRDLAEDSIRATPDRGYVDRTEVRRILDDHLAGRADNARLLWSLLMLELWFRLVVEAPVPTADPGRALTALPS